MSLYPLQVRRRSRGRGCLEHGQNALDASEGDQLLTSSSGDDGVRHDWKGSVFS